MKQFFEFCQHHWTLWLLFVVVLIWLVFEEFKNKIGGIPRLNPQGVTMLINREDAQVIDLRSHNVFLQGHILGAVNVPRAEIAKETTSIDAYKKQPVILVDDNDAAALPIGVKLQKLGFTKLYLLAGGMQKWKDASMPVAKK
jgi:rhodanese-related sulfurtransferase